MSPTIRIWIDKERQIIRQELVGSFEPQDFQQVLVETERLAGELDDPTCIRILVDGLGLGSASLAVRRQMLRSVHLPGFGRLAVYGASTFGRVVIRFLGAVAGTDKMRLFATEAEALAWLAELTPGSRP